LSFQNLVWKNFK